MCNTHEYMHLYDAYSTHMYMCSYVYMHICMCECIYIIYYISASAPLVEACLISINMRWSSVVQRKPPAVSEFHYEELIEIEMSQKGTWCAI